MIQGRDIICFSTADWDTALPTNKHQIMTRLARANRVLFVETLGTRTIRWGSGSDVARIRRRLGRALAGPRRVHPVFWPVGRKSVQEETDRDFAASLQRRAGLWVLSPLVYPRWSNPWVSSLNRAAFSFQLRRALLSLRFRRVLAWVYSPHAVWVLDAIRPATVLYHMVDDLSAIPGAESRSLRMAEAALLRRADHVVCTESDLFQRARAHHPSPLFMENVADSEHFRAGDPAGLSDQGRRVLSQIQALPPPRLLFSGHLAPHKVDFDLLLAVKNARPDWSLILLGPEWEGAELPPAFHTLKLEERVCLPGRVDYRDLPPLLHAADVLLIPYLLNAVTRHVSPLKFFEYLSTGKPIVATPLPSIQRYRHLAGLAPNAGAFIDAIETALQDPDSAREQRLDLARRQTWDQRIEEISRVLGP